MPDLSAIGGVAASVNALVTIVKAMSDVRDGNLVMSKVADLNRVILDLQRDMVTATTEQLSLVQELAKLKAELARAAAWAEEKKRYRLKEMWPGVFAFELIPSSEGSEPRHFLCANCFAEGKKSYLQKTISGSRLDRFNCNTCNDELTHDKDTGPISARPRPPRYED